MVGAVLILTLAREERNRASMSPTRLDNFINPYNRGVCFTVYLKTLDIIIRACQHVADAQIIMQVRPGTERKSSLPYLCQDCTVLLIVCGVFHRPS
jgi:hypothetical protein